MMEFRSTVSAAAPTGWRRAAFRAVVLLLALGLAVWVLYASPLRSWLGDLPAVRRQLEGFGAAAPIIFAVGVSVLVALGCPRLIFCPLGGLLFGFWTGLFWTQLGTLLGSYLTFLFIRWGGQQLVRRHWHRVARLDQFLRERGLVAVLVMRQLPISSGVLNLLFALSPVRHRAFLLGTLLGNLPEGIPCTLLGGSLLLHDWHQGALWVAGAVGLLVAVWVGSWIYLRRGRMAREVKDTVEQAMQEEVAP
jgi:uncharacterized membrane protein YdjX (TVP38/TMEM64 family)